MPFTSEEYSPGLGMDFYALALIFLTISTTAGAINFIVTILRLRAPGMSINRIPRLPHDAPIRERNLTDIAFSLARPYPPR